MGLSGLHCLHIRQTYFSSDLFRVYLFQPACACSTQPVFPVAVILSWPFVIRKIFTAAVLCIPSVQIIQHFLPLCPFLRVRSEMRPSVFGRCSTYPSAVWRDQKPSVFRYSRSVPEIKFPVYSRSTEPLIHDILHALVSHTQKPGAKPREMHALAALTMPLVYTYTKRRESLAYGERSHQIAAVLVPLCLYLILLFPAE